MQRITTFYIFGCLGNNHTILHKLKKSCDYSTRSLPNAARLEIRYSPLIITSRINIADQLK